MDFNEHQRASLETWWQTLDDDAQQRMLELPAAAPIPADIVPSLSAARITFVMTWWESHQEDAMHHQPPQMRDFLAEKRGEKPRR